MPYEPSFGTIESTGGSIEARKPESTFRIAVLADFSGRQNRGVTGSSEEIAARRLLRVSRDDLDDVMAKLGVQLKLPVGDDGDTVSVSFASLDDFHPDQIHDRVEQIADLYEADEKSALMNAVLHHADFQALESAWRGVYWLLGRVAKGGQAEVLLVDVSFAELAADLKAAENLTTSGLHQLLIEKGVRGPQGEPWAVLVGNYVFDLTGQHAELLGRLAKIASQTHAPFLTTVHPQIVDKSFTLSPDAAPAWTALRQLPEAALLGLSVPRFLLRLPYGENTKSIDKFSYEEMSRPPDRSHYLWGNPALGCATLLAQAFKGGRSSQPATASVALVGKGPPDEHVNRAVASSPDAPEKAPVVKERWDSNPHGASLDLENLPIHVYTVDDEEEVTLAEARLARPQTEALVKLGIMPFLCVRGKGAMQLLLFLSLAEPGMDQPTHGLQQSPAPAADDSPAPPTEEEPRAEEEPAAEEEPRAEEESATEEAPPAEGETPAEEEMDPDLAAVLKELEGGT